ncbi:hypothetical protein [Paraburkholderia sp.]|uniref:hypothetical protein n=1 Tax=Paraburkholderia sp. TaxID=1926495 RepID=UPI0025D47F55|nr:hypothetical protein [Paraburkholderia sp.]
MEKIPDWFQQLEWSKMANVAVVNNDRGIIPDFPGCYVFMEFAETPRPGRVLYVGQASTSLRQRLASYLVSIRTTKTKARHKGKSFVLEARHTHTDQGVYLQWVEYGGNKHDIDILEASLINYLNPAANDREDDTRHPLLGSRDRLHPDLLRQ